MLGLQKFREIRNGMFEEVPLSDVKSLKSGDILRVTTHSSRSIDAMWVVMLDKISRYSEIEVKNKEYYQYYKDGSDEIDIDSSSRCLCDLDDVEKLEVYIDSHMSMDY